MAQSDAYKRTGQGGGMDTDSSFEDIAPNDAVNRINLRNTGTAGQQLGYDTNIESNSALSGSLLPGINQVIGGNSFDDSGQISPFRYNSAGNCQIVLYDYTTNTYKVIYTDKTDSGGKTLLPLNPQNNVLAFLVNETYMIWWAKDLEVGYVNLKTLASGGYGTVLWEDLSLLKPQCPIPPTGVYGSDAGQPANYLYGNLPQFIVQYVNADFNYSAWSTRSKRIVPYQENTPTLGANVAQNNYIIVSVNIGSARATTINIAREFDDSGDFSQIKSVDRAYVIALTHTSVDISTQVYEAYDPATNLYSFAYYNNTIAIPIPAPETDLLYDYIWQANSGCLLNGNIAAIADWKTLYARPKTNISVSAIGYNPNISIPSGTFPNPFKVISFFPGESGSGAGDHKRRLSITLGGIPHTGDIISYQLTDIRNAGAVINSAPYIVPSGQDGDLVAVGGSFAETIPGSNYYDNGDGTVTINFVGPPYYGLTSVPIELFFAGATVSNSIPSVLDNTTYQAAIEYFDYKNRPFPINTDNTFIFTTPSYAQVNGQALQIIISILTANAPVGAVDYQIILTKPPILKVLDVMGAILAFKGEYDAYTHSPGLTVNSGSIGDTYQITAPANPGDTAHYTNLGTGEAYKTGDYVTNVGGTASAAVGQYYAVLPRTFGNLAGNEVLALSLNPLNLFNTNYSQQGVPTVLGYDYSVGDRCTFHYWIDAIGNINYFNAPCVNVAVLGYDPGTYIVKLEKSASFTYSSGHIYYNGNQIDVKNIFFRLYSPAPQTQTASTTQSETVWFEVGSRHTITNGVHDDLNITINDGGVYYKTRQYANALLPYTNPPLQTLSTDFNYSDFYPSAYASWGRPRTYYDVLEQTEQKASIITSQPYILGSKVNGLNRFYPANIYGDSNGQTSSSNGSIQIMWQRGQVLVTIQQLGTFYIPVNEAYTVLNQQLTGQSISEKLLNNGRYDPENIGLGTTKCFCTRYSTGWGIDPNKSLPYKWTVGGIEPISGKMSKYFKSVIQLAYSLGKKINMFYNDYYEEVVLTIQADGGQLFFFPFKDGIWDPFNHYVITGSDVSDTPNGAHCTASYDSATGLVTYTPAANYVGNDTATFTFNPGTGNITLNNCLQWTGGNTNVNSFSFAPQTGVPLSTLIYSNIILVSGNDVPVAISISGGQYSVNGGSWTSSSGFVNQFDTVQVRQTSSGSELTETIITLTISAVVAPFSVTTGTTDVDAFTFIDLTDQPISTLIESNVITVSGPTIPVSISVTGGEYSKNGGAYTSVTGTAVQGDTVQVRQTSSASPSTTTDVVLTVGATSDTWSVTTSAGGGGYFELAVDGTSYNYTLVGVTGTGLPSGTDTANVDPGDSKFFALSGTVLSPQTLHIEITSSAPVPDMEIQIYYSLDSSYHHYPILASGTYDVPLLHDIADPDYLIITIKPA